MNTTQPVEQEIHALEYRRYQAMIDVDVDTLEPLLGERLVYTHSSGAVDGKTTYLKGVKAKKFDYRKIERSDEQIHVYGDMAVVTGRARVDLVVAGVPRVADLRYTSVWAKTPGVGRRWHSRPPPFQPECVLNSTRS